MDPVRTLVTAAAESYTANCALGGSVALGLLDTSNVRWVHHLSLIHISEPTRQVR